MVGWVWALVILVVLIIFIRFVTRGEEREAFGRRFFDKIKECCTRKK